MTTIRAAILSSVLTAALFVPTALRGEILFTGTLVSWSPQGLVIKTDKGNVPVALHPNMQLSVRAVAMLENLPEATPCFLIGTAPTSGKELMQNPTAHIFIAVGGTTYPPSQQYVTLGADGEAKFYRVPGLLRKGAQATFEVGPNVLHRTGGNSKGGPAANVFGGKTLTMPKTFEMEFDFGTNLNQAGKDAKVTVSGTPQRPTDLTIVVDRTEPLQFGNDKATGAAKK